MTNRHKPFPVGVGLVWHSQDPELLDRIAERGFFAQVMIEWADFEKGNYPYDYLDDLHDRGIRYVLQINGKRRPMKIFQNVPFYLADYKQVDPTEPGIPMYWHPDYAQYEQALAELVSERLDDGTFAGAVALRHSDRFIGTENSWPEQDWLDDWKTLNPRLVARARRRRETVLRRDPSQGSRGKRRAMARRLRPTRDVFPSSLLVATRRRNHPEVPASRRVLRDCATSQQTRELKAPRGGRTPRQ